MNSAPRNKPNLLSVAWIGHGDFGDEVMAYVMRSFLKSLGMEKLTYYEAGPEPRFIGKNDLFAPALHRHDTRSVVKKIFDAFALPYFDALVIGGGSIFHSANSIKWKHEITRKMKYGNRNAFTACVGVSLGPFATKNDEAACGKLLDEIDIVILRDESSYAIAKSISRNPNIHTSFDSSFLLQDIRFQQMKIKKPLQRKTVGIILVYGTEATASYSEECLISTYTRIVEHTLKKDHDVMLLTLYTGSSFQDRRINKEIQRRINQPDRVRMHEFGGDITKTIEALSNCDVIISMRLHGIIFAYALGIPFISIGYNPKNRFFCTSVHYPERFTFEIEILSDIRPLLDTFDELCQQDRSVFAESEPVEKISSIVRHNFDLFGKALRRHLLQAGVL
ncbi:polysaccharide pyruvyl transferase family protein [Candidatus Uhrbacteria bacterium]|nr:polysaccharide pyruvyl transferase family protein [Candidatus Uhrbacteria bacterium]